MSTKRQIVLMIAVAVVWLPFSNPFLPWVIESQLGWSPWVTVGIFAAFVTVAMLALRGIDYGGRKPRRARDYVAQGVAILGLISFALALGDATGVWNGFFTLGIAALVWTWAAVTKRGVFAPTEPPSGLPQRPT